MKPLTLLASLLSLALVSPTSARAGEKEAFEAILRFAETQPARSVSPKTPPAAPAPLRKPPVASREVRATPGPAPAIRTGYPSRSVSGRTWTGCPNWTHLAGGPHRGKFDPSWLASLTWAQLQSLHADDHEGNVRWQYVVRPGTQTQVQTRSRTVIQYSSPTSSNCPNGQCPNVRRFRWGR